jgi:hypothetical protein
MTRDFADFLAALNNSEGASYVVIGGMAVLSYVPYRTTRDVGVLIEPTLENARRVREAVRRWGGFEPVYTPEDFISGDFLSFGGLLRVEVHAAVPGATWEGVWARQEAAGRPEKDLPDLKRLRRPRERRQGSP